MSTNTQNMNQFISLLITLLVFSSCFPGGEDDFEGTQLRGTVVEFGTLDPVPNALVPLFGVVSQGGLQNPILYLVDTVRTDIDGEFFLLTDDDATTFELGKISADGYFPYSGNQSTLVFPGENENYVPEFVLDPEGSIRLIVKDSLEIDKSFKRLSAWFIGLSSISLDIDEIHNCRANRYQSINIIDDEDNLHKDSIYIIKNDTVTYRLTH
jgi:hypothetical protein